MEKGNIVFNNYEGIRRYGVVTDRFMKEKWVYVRVNWIDDDEYERAMSWREEIGEGNHRLEEYRIDEVTTIDAERELLQLRKCLKLSTP